MVLLTTAGYLGQAAWYATAHWAAVLRGPGGRYADVSQLGDQLTATWSATGLLVGFVTSLAAGVGEEVCALAVPVWLADQAGALDGRWRGGRRLVRWVVPGLLVFIRVTYHLYLGPVALFYLPWAAATVWLYLRTRLLLPIVVAHVLMDFSQAVLRPLPLSSLWAKYSVDGAALVLPALVLMLLTRPAPDSSASMQALP